MTNLENNKKESGEGPLYRRVQGVVGEVSFSLILPKEYATALGIQKGDYLKVFREGASLRIVRAEEGRAEIKSPASS